MLIQGMLPFVNQTLIALFLAAMLLPALIGTARGQMMCSKPLQPLCSLDDQGLADAVARSQCREDVRNYRSELREFRRCLDEAAERVERELAEAGRFLGCLEDREESCELETQRGY